MSQDSLRAASRLRSLGFLGVDGDLLTSGGVCFRGEKTLDGALDHAFAVGSVLGIDFVGVVNVGDTGGFSDGGGFTVATLAAEAVGVVTEVD